MLNSLGNWGPRSLRTFSGGCVFPPWHSGSICSQDSGPGGMTIMGLVGTGATTGGSGLVWWYAGGPSEVPTTLRVEPLGWPLTIPVPEIRMQRIRTRLNNIWNPRWFILGAFDCIPNSEQGQGQRFTEVWAQGRGMDCLSQRPRFRQTVFPQSPGTKRSFQNWILALSKTSNSAWGGSIDPQKIQTPALPGGAMRGSVA